MQQDQRIELHQIRTFGDIMNDTFKLLQQSFKVLGKSLLFIVGPFLLALSISAGLLYGEMFGNLGNIFSPKAMSNMNNMDTFNNYFTNIFGVKYFLIILLSVIISLLLQLIVYEYIDLYSKKHYNEITFEDVLAATKKDFWMIFWTNIGLGFFSIIAIAVLAASTVIIKGFSIFLIIVLGIYFIITLSFVPVMRITERVGFFKSIQRSIKLIYGSWWSTLGLLIIMGLIVLMSGSMLGLPNTILILFVGFSGATGSGTQVPYVKVLFIITTTIYMLIYFLYAIPMVGIALKYFSCVEKKEGTGLLKKIDGISEGMNDSRTE